MFKLNSAQHSLTSTVLNGRSIHSEYKLVLDSIPSIVLYLDHWGVIRYANAPARVWRHESMLIGRTLVEVDGGIDFGDQQREVMQVARSGAAVMNVMQRIHADGMERWFKVDKIPLPDSTENHNGVLVVMTDITESIEKDRALRESEDRYHAFISTSSDAIWCYELTPPMAIDLPLEEKIHHILNDAVLTEANTQLAMMSGVDHVDEIIGRPLYKNGSLSNRRNIQQFIQNNYRLHAVEFRRVMPSGDRLTMQMSVNGVVEGGYLRRAWGTTRDITERQKYLDTLEHLANHDVLTSLPNRSMLAKEMRDAFARSRSTATMALMLIDLDRFKEINDTLGHEAGDKVLKQLGPRLEVELGSNAGLVARLGGDEFAVFLPKVRNRQQVAVLAHRFLDCISQVFEIEGFQTEISASIGIALSPDHANDSTTLMRFADVAMYHAKNRLRGVSIYDSNFDAHTTKRLALMGAIGTAIREEQLCLHYQPKVDFRTNKTYGFEALIRWNHPTMGFIPPSDFVPIIEMSSFIYAMSAWVLENTIKQCAAWHRLGYSVVCGMNLSTRNLLDDRIVNDLEKLLKEYNLPGDKIEMEITESTLMSDPERAQVALTKMASLGVGLAIDDYGTGYSSLAYLKRLPVKTLKIDGSFVRGMANDEQNEIIVNSTIQLAHNLGLKVVAEGVEDLATFDHLKRMNCDFVQGYYISKPMLAEEIVALLAGSQWDMITESDKLLEQSCRS